MVHANEYADSPTEEMIESSRKKSVKSNKKVLDHLEKELMMLELMTNHSDHSKKIADLKQKIKHNKVGGKSRKRRTYKRRF
jgi:hypothetical protein